MLQHSKRLRNQKQSYTVTICEAAVTCVVDICRLTFQSFVRHITGSRIMYLNTLLNLNPSVLVIVHHLMNVSQGFQAVSISLAYTWWSHNHAWICQLYEC